MVLFAGADRRRSPIRVLRIGLRLRPRLEIGGRRLEQRLAGSRNGEQVIQLLRLVLPHGIGETVTKLVESERDRAIAVGGVAEHRPGGLESGEGQRQAAPGTSRGVS